MTGTRVAGPGVAGHRRRWTRSRLRRFELGAWVSALVVAAVIASGVVVLSVRAGQRSSTGPASGQTDAAIAPAAAPCIFESCGSPVPTGEPTRLRIPAIGVDTELEVLGLDTSGRLTPPRSYVRAGWFGAGVVPGDLGPAVVAGHVDSLTGPAVFYRLHAMPVGALVEVMRGGEWVRFRVTAVDRYPKDQFPTDEVYRPTPGPELRLITCGGQFDHRHLSYRDNIVAYAVLA